GYTSDGTTAWTANTCCSNNVPMAQADISAAYNTQAIDKTPGYKTWDLTTMVQEWASSPATNFGVLLDADTSKLRDHWRYFASMENATASLRPYLYIRYVRSSPDTTPPTVALTAPGSGATVTGIVTVSANAS